MMLLEETRMTLQEAADYMSSPESACQDHTIRRWITKGVGNPPVRLEGFVDTGGLKTTKEALGRFAEARARLYRVEPALHSAARTASRQSLRPHATNIRRAKEIGIL